MSDTTGGMELLARLGPRRVQAAAIEFFRRRRGFATDQETFEAGAMWALEQIREGFELHPKSQSSTGGEKEKT